MPSRPLAPGGQAGRRGAIATAPKWAQADRPSPCPGLQGRKVCGYLLFGRFVLEAGVLDVIGPDGLVLLDLGAQVLHSLGDGQPTALNILTADPVGNGPRAGHRAGWRPRAGGSEIPLDAQEATASSKQNKAALGPLGERSVEQLCQREEARCDDALLMGLRPDR